MESFLATCVIAGTPLVLATLGELITEKSGSLNLGVEGMMLMGAVMGFMSAYNTGNAGVAVICAALAGAGGALIFALLTVTLRANQTVTGLTLTIFGTGFAGFVGQPMIGLSLPMSVRTVFAKIAVPGLSKIPFIGPIFFKQDIFVYFAYAAIIVSCIYMYRTRLGLNMRSVGENAAAADASGVNVTLYKYAHILAGGALCGLGGAYLSLIRVPIWQADVVTGRGWIAVALVIFASWNPVKAFVGGVLFGGLSILGLRLQAMGFTVSQYLVDMVPYIATVLIVIISSHKKKKENQPPADLGNNYFREER
ncbi:MAG: ABC transporter permease [Anaerovoracaceae bacterium]